MSTALPGSRGFIGTPGPAGPGLKSFRATGVTDASGNVTFDLTPAAFAAPPAIAASIQGAASNNPVDCRVTARTATSCTVHVRQSPVLIVLSLSVLGVSAPLAGAVVHLVAHEEGVQV